MNHPMVTSVVIPPEMDGLEIVKNPGESYRTTLRFPLKAGEPICYDYSLVKQEGDDLHKCPSTKELDSVNLSSRIRMDNELIATMLDTQPVEDLHVTANGTRRCILETTPVPAVNEPNALQQHIKETVEKLLDGSNFEKDVVETFGEDGMKDVRICIMCSPVTENLLKSGEWDLPFELLVETTPNLRFVDKMAIAPVYTGELNDKCNILVPFYTIYHADMETTTDEDNCIRVYQPMFSAGVMNPVFALTDVAEYTKKVFADMFG